MTDDTKENLFIVPEGRPRIEREIGEPLKSTYFLIIPTIMPNSHKRNELLNIGGLTFS